MACLLDLPDHILADAILARLPPDAIAKAAQASRALHVLINVEYEESIWAAHSRSVQWLVRRRMEESTKSHFMRATWRPGAFVALGGDAGEIFPMTLDEHMPAGSVYFGFEVATPMREGYWSPKNLPDFRRWRNAPAATVDVEGRPWVIGGWDDDASEPLASIEALEVPQVRHGLLHAPRWEPHAIPDMPEPRCFAAATFDATSRLWVCGGGDGMARGASCLQSVVRYDPHANDDDDQGGRWESAGQMLVPRCGLALAADGRSSSLFLCGGYSGGLVYQKTVEQFDMEKCRSTMLPPMRHARSGAGAGVGPDGALYVCGGSNNGSSMLASCERYDSKSGAWHNLPKLPTARGYLSAAFGLDGCFYVAGGCAASSGIPVDAFEAFDPRAGRWRRLDPLPHPRSNHALVFAI